MQDFGRYNLFKAGGLGVNRVKILNGPWIRKEKGTYLNTYISMNRIHE